MVSVLLLVDYCTSLQLGHTDPLYSHPLLRQTYHLCSVVKHQCCMSCQKALDTSLDTLQGYNEGHDVPEIQCTQCCGVPDVLLCRHMQAYAEGHHAPKWTLNTMS